MNEDFLKICSILGIDPKKVQPQKTIKENLQELSELLYDLMRSLENAGFTRLEAFELTKNFTSNLIK